MKASGVRWKIGLSLMGVLSLIAVGVWLVDSVFLTYPTPETQSQFFKSYSPEETLKPFIIPGHLQPRLESTESGAGRGIATHRKNFEAIFAVRADDRANLVSTVFEDLLSQLKNTNARILRLSGDASSGFDLEYGCGKTRGRVMIEPPKIIEAERVVGHVVSHSGRLFMPPPLKEGELPVSVRVTIDEKWYKSAQADVNSVSGHRQVVHPFAIVGGNRPLPYGVISQMTPPPAEPPPKVVP